MRALCVQKGFSLVVCMRRLSCLVGKHLWKGCTCSACGSIRDKEHNWDGCKCKLCGTSRKFQHEWNGCICIRCGASQHKWGKEIVVTCPECYGNGVFAPKGWGSVYDVPSSMWDICNTCDGNGTLNTSECVRCGEKTNAHGSS